MYALRRYGIHPDDNYFDYYRTSFPCLQIDFPKEREKRETRRKRIIIIIAHWYICARNYYRFV